MYIRSLLNTTLTVLVVFLSMMPAAQAKVMIIFNHNNHKIKITTDNNNVTITNSESQKATITPTGELIIHNKPVDVSPAVMKTLRDYDLTAVYIGQQAQEIVHASERLAGDAIGAAFAALFEGDEGVELTKKMKQKTEPLKQKGRALCGKVKQLEILQDQIAAEVPDFRPYAILDNEAKKCMGLTSSKQHSKDSSQ